MILGGGLPARTAVSPPPRRRPGIRGAAAGRAMRPPHPIPGQVASNTLQGTINAPAPKPLGGSEAAGCGRPRPAQPASGRDAHEPIDATPSARHGLPGHTPPQPALESLFRSCNPERTAGLLLASRTGLEQPVGRRAAARPASPRSAPEWRRASCMELPVPICGAAGQSQEKERCDDQPRVHVWDPIDRTEGLKLRT
jgi:hypothetical protein